MNKKYIVPCTESQVVFSHMIMVGSPVAPNNGTTPISTEETDYID